MRATDLQYMPPDAAPLDADAALLLAHLPLDGARVLELGCGSGQLARELLDGAPIERYAAAEVDLRQHEQNLRQPADPRLEFRVAAAERLDLDDASFDVVLMMRSLHHVPPASMEAALGEVARVLRPGGVAWIAEPVYAGPLNALLSLFHDEREVRAAAFEAVRQALAAGRFELVAQRFYAVERRFADFADFDARILQATHTDHRLSPDLRARVEARFRSHAGPGGARFESPVRVEHLRRPTTGAI